MRVFLLVLILVLACPGGAPRAQTAVPEGGEADQPLPSITVDPGDTPLVIRGDFAPGQALTGNLRLIAQGGDVTGFAFLASDLTGEADQPTVGRQNVTLVGTPDLAQGRPQDFQIKVQGLSEPGTYSGRIFLLPPGQPRDAALEIPLRVIAKARPEVALLDPGGISLRLVTCTGGIDCALARLLLPASAFADSRQIQLDNKTPAPVELTRVTVVASGAETGAQLTGAVIAVPALPLTLPPEQIVSLPLTLKRSDIPPDRYSGSLYLAFEKGDGNLQVPLDIALRGGPFWPIVILFLGIVLGRVVKFMQERGGPQADALAAVNRFHDDLRAAHPDDRALLAPQLEEIRRAVHRERLDKVTAQLETLRGRLDMLHQLRRIDSALQGKQHPLIKSIAQKIALARERIRLEQDVKEAMDAIAKEVAQLQTSLMGAGAPADPQIALAGQAAASGRTAAATVTVMALRGMESDAKRWIRDKLAALTGLSDELRAQATLWLVRPLLYLFLMAMLVVVGLNSFYVTDGASFGARPFVDSLSLLLWGLSADVASRTLSNLQGNKPS